MSHPITTMHYRSIIEEVKRKIEELHVFIRIYDPRQLISLNQLEPGTISVMRCKDGFRGVSVILTYIADFPESSKK